MFFIVKANILQNPADIGFFSAVGTVMKTKHFTNLVYQASGFRRELPCWFVHIGSPLCISSFSRYFHDIRNDMTYIKEKYEELEDLLIPG